MGVWAATVPLLMACGKDPILERAEAVAKAEGAPAQPQGAPPGGEGQPRRANVGDPQPTENIPGGAAVPGAAITPGVPEEPKPGVPGSPQPAPPGAGEGLTPGVPVEPKPGVPTEPKPALPGAPQQFTGPKVRIRGVTEFAAYKRGTVRITAFDGPHSAKSKTPPKVVGSAEVDKIGAFVLEVQQNVGRIYIEAVVDEDGDGRPGPLDPHGNADRYPLTIATEDVDGLTVELAAQAPPPTGTKGDF